MDNDSEELKEALSARLLDCQINNNKFINHY